MKKVLSLILALVMLSTVLFGCGNSNSRDQKSVV